MCAIAARAEIFVTTGLVSKVATVILIDAENRFKITDWVTREVLLAIWTWILRAGRKSKRAGLIATRQG